jgi:hypothetical protein
VFSPDGSHLAAKVEKGGKYTFAVDGRLWDRQCEAVWDPAFSPDGSLVLLKSLEEGTYFRRVMPVADIAG